MNVLLGWKLGALAALLVAAVLGGFVPLYWERLRDSPVALGYWTIVTPSSIVFPNKYSVVGML